MFTKLTLTATLLYCIINTCIAQDDYPTFTFAAKAIHTIKLKGYPDFLAASGDDVWVTNLNKLEKLSAKNSMPILSVDVPNPCGAPVVANGYLYVASCSTNSIYCISDRTGKIVSIIPTTISDTTGEISLAFGAGSLWILSDSNGMLSRINPITKATIARIKVKPHAYCAGFGLNSVWITNSTEAGSVQRIDVLTNRVTATIAVGPNPHFLTVASSGVFTLNQTDGSISHIDPLTNQLAATIKAGLAGSGGDIDADNYSVWVRAKNGAALVTINAHTNTIINKYLPLCGSGAVRVTKNYIWVTAHDVNTVWALKNTH